MWILFLPDDTWIRTSEGQDYKRTVYLLDHNVTAAVVSTSTIFLQICIFYEIIFFPHDPWIQPTKTRLISGQSIYEKTTKSH